MTYSARLPHPSPLSLSAFLLFLALIPHETQSAERDLKDPHRLNTRTRQLLEQNRKAQLAASSTLQLFHGFQFTDRVSQSGITFQNMPVEDAAKHWKPAHYDHGTGLAVADVDGDGRLDLYFVKQTGGSQLWRNLGNGRFENITATAGVGLDDRILVAAAFADIDNDGDPDLFVTTVKMGNVLFENLGNGRFRDISAESGLDYRGHSSGAVFFDFDRDGLLDLFVANVGEYTSNDTGKGGYFLAHRDAFKSHLRPERSEKSLLYRNLGGRKFKEVSREMNLEHAAWSGDASPCDLNEDGYPDLYVVNMQGDDRYYENQSGRSFLEKTAVYFPKTPWGAMGLKFFDYNLDGRPDLYVTDMHSDMTEVQTRDGKTTFRPDFEKRKSEAWCSTEWTDEFLQGASNNIFGNAFYENKGGGRFEEVSDRIGAETYWPWGVSVGDLNADAYEDVFVTAGMGWPFRYGINSVLLNDAGRRFVDSEFLLGVEPRKDGRIETPYFVLDCYGEDKDHELCDNKKGRIRVHGSLSSRSSAMLDLDDDGDLDIVTNEMIGSPQVLISDLTQKRPIRFLKVRLVGTRSNRDGLGAVVRLHAGSKVQTRCNDGKSGYLSQSAMPLYFGLGDAAKVDRIEVLWPSGRTQTLPGDIAANGLVEIREPVE